MIQDISDKYKINKIDKLDKLNKLDKLDKKKRNEKMYDNRENLLCKKKQCTNNSINYIFF